MNTFGLVDRVLKVRGLLDSGIPTRIIGYMLPCLGEPAEVVVVDPDPELRELLVRERDKMTERIGLLQHNRDALDSYIEAMDGHSEHVRSSTTRVPQKGAEGSPPTSERPPDLSFTLV